MPAQPPAPIFAGFDISKYPGEQKMTVWKASSPYCFVGYYLQAPCHHSASWMGQRETLAKIGWNLLPVYVGQQAAGVSPCSSGILTAAQGNTDGQDAAAKMTSEGFAPATYIYLDVERIDVFPSAWTDYVKAWTTQVDASGFGVGVYCHRHNASAVKAAVVASAPRYWIVGGDPKKFDIHTSPPAKCGVSFANLWQCPVSVTKTFGGVSLKIDEDVSQWPAPA